MSRRKQQKPRAQRLIEQVQIGLEIKEAFEKPAIKHELAMYRVALVEAMASCDVLDDAGRRGYAVRVQELDNIVKMLSGRISEGERASLTLAGMEDNV